MQVLSTTLPPGLDRHMVTTQSLICQNENCYRVYGASSLITGTHGSWAIHRNCTTSRGKYRLLTELSTLRALKTDAARLVAATPIGA
ncbi:hypothetical protein OPT61_g9252 [Boeremia exigua]|uniref:Uncharacterized protein n=1 Tax=Boeremia exigua TaxID=749465 RepID=A0ACC2HUW8_9PLEO|nr:hypothetical protein OPT61_g9252 [Boeremia exigua]